MPVIIRETTAADIPALTDLHVKTWNATYPDVPKKPTYEIRERQWRQAFEVMDGSWFCFVVEGPNGARDDAVAAYAVARPDRRWSLLLLNKDPARARQARRDGD